MTTTTTSNNTNTLATTSARHGAVSCTFDASAAFPFKDLLIYNGTVRVPECKLAIRCKNDIKKTLHMLLQYTLAQHFAAAFSDGRAMAGSAVPDELQACLCDKTFCYGIVLPFGGVLALNPTWPLTHRTHLSRNMAFFHTIQGYAEMLAALGGSEDRLWHAFASQTAWEVSEFFEYWLAQNQTPGFVPRNARLAPQLTAAQLAALSCNSALQYRGPKVLEDMRIPAGVRSGPKNIRELRPATQITTTAAAPLTAHMPVETTSLGDFFSNLHTERKKRKQKTGADQNALGALAAVASASAPAMGDEKKNRETEEEEEEEVVAGGDATLQPQTEPKRRRVVVPVVAKAVVAQAPVAAIGLQQMGKDEQLDYLRNLFCGTANDVKALCEKNPGLAIELGLMSVQSAVMWTMPAENGAGFKFEANAPEACKKAEEMTPDDKARSDFTTLANRDIILPQREFAPDYPDFSRTFQAVMGVMLHEAAPARET